MRNQKVSSEKREQWLAEFKSSGLSAAAFARHYGIKYTTFCSLRRRAAKLPISDHPRLIEVVSDFPSNGSVEVQIGTSCRIQVSSREQAELTAAIIRELEAKAC